MNKSVFIVFLLFSVSAFSQENVNPELQVSTSKLSVGINFSTDYCYRTLKNDHNKSELIMNVRNEVEAPKIGYTAGVSIIYKFTNQFSILSGLCFSNKEYTIGNWNDNSYGLFFSDPVDPRYGFTYKTLSLERLYYLDIPVKAIFMYGSKPLQFVSGIGVTANLLIDGVFSGDENENSLYRYNTFNISASLSAGAAYNLNNRINLRIEPVFNYGLLRLYDDSYNEHLWNAGINVSCYYNLK